MAVGVELNFVGATLEQYDQVLLTMGLTLGGRTAPGGLFHWVTKTEDGIRVVDVWETKEQFERFAEEQIGPYEAEAGFPGEPEVRFSEVCNYLAAG